MLRYVLSFPGEMRCGDLEVIKIQLDEAASNPKWRDVVLANEPCTHGS